MSGKEGRDGGASALEQQRQQRQEVRDWLLSCVETLLRFERRL